MVVWLAWLGWLACETSGPIRSEPSEPTVTFDDEAEEQEIVWSDLGQVFPQRPASLPEPLAGLVPGMEGGAARTLLVAAHEPGVKIYGQVVEDKLVIATIVRGTKHLGVTVILDAEGTKLLEVDVTLPDPVAIPLLATRWGEPTSVEYVDGGKSISRWVGDPWIAELHPDAGANEAGASPVSSSAEGKAILRYIPAGSVPVSP